MGRPHSLCTVLSAALDPQPCHASRSPFLLWPHAAISPSAHHTTTPCTGPHSCPVVPGVQHGHPACPPGHRPAVLFPFLHDTVFFPSVPTCSLLIYLPAPQAHCPLGASTWGLPWPAGCWFAPRDPLTGVQRSLKNKTTGVNFWAEPSKPLDKD